MAPPAEPEEEMVAVGNELLKPPAEEEPLLELLGRAELFLSKVEQSPQPAMLKALDPVMKALVADKLLRHPNADVKVAVASCISEITRITAPEAPYDDDLMKTIFELIVEAFGDLNESPQLSEISYRRRLSILETVAKVRSCVVMLDLECDGLILEMFRHFFRARRTSHPDSAFSFIETIMTVVLEESEDFSSELICCLLDSVKKDNKDSYRELGENVIAKCGTKLKPYLLKEIESRGASLSDYSRIVDTICHKSSDAPENNALSVPVVEDDSKLSERTVSEELQQGSTRMNGDGFEDVGTGDKSPEPVQSNGVVPVTKELAESASPSVHSEQTVHGDTKETEVHVIAKSNDLDSLGGKTRKISRQNAKKSKGRKGNSLVKSAEMTDGSAMGIDKDNTNLDDQENNTTSHKILETEALSDDKMLAELQLPVETSNKGGLNSDPSRPKRGRPHVSNASSKKVKSDLFVSPSTGKKVSVRERDETQLSKGRDKNTEHAHTLHSGEKSSKSSTSKDGDMNEKPEKLDSDALLKRREEETHHTELKPAKKLGKKSEKITDNESSREPHGRKGRPRKAGMNTEKDAAENESSFANETFSSPDIAAKSSAGKDEVVSEDALLKKSRRKHSQEEKKDLKELDETLTGSSIRVWWPDDKKFYSGTITAYDSSTKKHTVTYEDGDVEVLFLKDERWKLVKTKSSKDEIAEKSGEADVEESPGTPPKNKAKLSSDSAGRKGTKSDNLLKRGGSAKVKGDGKRVSDEIQDVDSSLPEASNKTKQKSGGSSTKHFPGDSSKKEKTSIKSNTETMESAEAVESKKEKTPKHWIETKDEAAVKSSKKNKENLEIDASDKDVASPSRKSEKKNVAETAVNSGGSKSVRKNKGGNRSAANGTSFKELSSPKTQGNVDASPKVHDGSRKRGRPSKS